jgi:Leucine-rich repeat (LRR) protein
VPPEFFVRFSMLKELLLGCNKLRSVPVEIGMLTSLRVLRLANNMIEHLPSSVGKCKRLEEIDVHNNLLSVLPFDLGSIPPLTALNCDGNPLREPPLEVVLQGQQRLITYIRLLLSGRSDPFLLELRAWKLRCEPS